MLTEQQPSKRQPTYTHDASPSAAPSAAPSAQTSEAGPSRFLTVLVTPKLNFSLPCKPSWKVADDIDQDEVRLRPPLPPRPPSLTKRPAPPPRVVQLRAAFLTRFPVRFAAEKLHFRCATPGEDITQKDRLVFRISADGADDERVLLMILKELDSAYNAKFEAQLEQARADMLSSSMTFQVVADEIREGQAECQRKFEKETRSMKEHLSINQKRLFLLEQEKVQLQQTASAAESMTGGLRRSVAGLSEENAQLKSRMSELEAQLHTMSTVLAHAVENAGGAQGSSPRALATALASGAASSQRPRAQMEAQTQTEADEEAKRWQEQLVAVSQWLQTGAALLQLPPSPSAPSGQ